MPGGAEGAASPYGPMLVVVNPRAGRGAVERGWSEAERVIRDGGLEYEVVLTEAPGHAAEATRTAIEKGIKFVVAVGGDGTIGEVVNGMMGVDGPLDPEAVLGVVPAGSGSDFVRTFGLPHDPVRAAEHLLGKTLWGKLDIGRVVCRGSDGATRARWFVNVAEAGIGAHVVQSAARLPGWLAGRSYRLAALKGVVTYRPQDASVRMRGRKARGLRPDAPLEDGVARAGRFTMVVVANCQFFGGGLRVAPRAIPSDAMLDVLIGEGSKADAVRALKRMPRGEHVPDDTIAEFLADRVVLDAPEPVAVEADGELLGTTPATFDLVPAAIALKI